MQPKIAKANTVISFHISPQIVANLLGNIESAGVIQYHHMLVFFGEDKQPCLFTASEWSKFDPELSDMPVFGIFLNSGHKSQGGSSDWLDPAIFALHSIHFAKKHFGIVSEDLCEGETWALTQIMKNLNEENMANHHEAYRKALSKYDDRLAKFLHRTIAK